MAAQQNAIDSSALDALYTRAIKPVAVRFVTEIVTLSAVPIILVITVGVPENGLLKVKVASLYEPAGTVTPANVRLSILLFSWSKDWDKLEFFI
jgi:hypothetical protein